MKIGSDDNHVNNINFYHMLCVYFLTVFSPFSPSPLPLYHLYSLPSLCHCFVMTCSLLARIHLLVILSLGAVVQLMRAVKPID